MTEITISKQALDELTNIGINMSNICFNMSFSGSIGKAQKAILKGANQRWDAALRGARSSMAALAVSSAMIEQNKQSDTPSPQTREVEND